MTEQEREKLVEKIAREISRYNYDTPWTFFLPEARAALAVAEPVIREQEDNPLREENMRLRAALQPFSDLLEELEKSPLTKYVCATSVEIEHLRAAAAAIREGVKRD